MAKKGGAQLLQTDISTDEDLHKFLERTGLIICDVYSEWCGPCLAMVNSLRKVKLELGGDNLHLATCKCDYIEALSRFRNRSEPTWLFINRGKVVNLKHGTDVPKLMKVIEEELAMLNETDRITYEINELLPEEREKLDVIEKAEAEALRKEQEEAERLRIKYLTEVTDEIIENLPDMGVTIFGPHIGRDSYKKIMEVADTHKLQCKDRKTQQLQVQQFDTVNFACENPIDPEALEHLCNKDVLLVYWKVTDYRDKELQEIFSEFVCDISIPKTVLNDNGEGDSDREIPPLIAPLEIKVKITPEVKQQYLDAVVQQQSAPTADERDKADDDLKSDAALEEMNETVEGKNCREAPVEAQPEYKVISVPAVWTPSDRRTHATLIYVLFRNQTTTFLPPDPIPEPPHIVMAFDAYKRKEIFDVVEKEKDDILAFGFFSNDDPETAELLANTMEKYEQRTPAITDKLILKVAKVTNETKMSFITFGPTHISTNAVVGRQEALKLFPENFSNEEEPDYPEDEAS